MSTTEDNAWRVFFMSKLHPTALYFQILSQNLLKKSIPELSCDVLHSRRRLSHGLRRALQARKHVTVDSYSLADGQMSLTEFPSNGGQ